MAPQLIGVPSFSDGFIVRQSDLNVLAYDIDALAQITTGYPAAAGMAGPAVCKVNLTSPAPVPTNTGFSNEFINWGQAVVDPLGMWGGTAQPALVTVPIAGWYRVLIQAVWSSGGFERVIQILVNGLADPLNVECSSNSTMGGTGTFNHQTIGIAHLNAGATVAGACFHSAGSTINLLASGNYGTYMVVSWMAPY